MCMEIINSKYRIVVTFGKEKGVRLGEGYMKVFRYFYKGLFKKLSKYGNC